MAATEVRLSGCTAKYAEGTVSVISDRDPTDRLVWTISDAEAAARLFRFLAPELARALKGFTSVARVERALERRSIE